MIEDTLSPIPRFLDEAGAAELLTLSRSRLQKMRHFKEPGSPPFLRFGRSIRYERAALEMWIASRRFESALTPAFSERG